MAALGPFAATHARFALALHRAVAPSGPAPAPEPETNTVSSPWSVSSALAVLAAGADAAARAEIERALSAGSTPDPVPMLAADAAAVCRPGGEGGLLDVASTLWVHEGRTAHPDFAEHLRRWPGAGLRAVGFAADPEAARVAINDHTSRATHGLVPEILPTGSVTVEDRSVLVNVLYLLAGWLEPLFPERTGEEPFHAPSGVRAVPTMRDERDMPYATVAGWRYGALPLAMGLRGEILLPPAPPAPVDAEVLLDLRRAARPHRVRLHVPRFAVAGGGSIVAPLRRLGVSRVFDPAVTALQRVIVEEDLFVAGAYHQAVLRVDERGVEGAAATAVVARAVAFRILPEAELRVDRPFLFLVTHYATGAVLFLARVVEP